MTQLWNITYVIEGQSACSWYRCQTPGEELSRHGQRVVVAARPDRALLESSDIVVLLRPSRPEMLEMLKFSHSLGKKVVVDLDDDLWNLPSSSPYVGYWSSEGAQHVLSTAVANADLVTVTTPELAAVVRTLNRSVAVLPNMLPGAHWPASVERPERRDDPLVIGWAGGASHFMDLKVLSGVVESLLQRYPGIEFAFAGMPQLPFAPHDRIRIMEPVPLEHYPSLLRGFDIALAPVVDDRFNRSKSDLKYVEYAMLGLPVVASAGPTYSRTVRPGENGFLARNAKDWIKHVVRLVDDEALRLSVGDAARRTAEGRLIERNVQLWERAYGSMT